MTGTQLRDPTRVSSPWLLGCTRELLRDPLGLGMRAFEECGDVARYDLGPLGPRRPNFGVNHPDGAARVFSAATYRDYRKDSRFFGPLRDLYGDGLLTSQDETWLRQRRFIQPLFITRSVDGYATVMAREVDRLSGEWRGQPDSEAVDLHAEIVRLTLRIVARVLFGADAERMLPVVRSDFPVLGRAALRRFTVPYPAPLSWPTPANRRIARARARIAAVCDEIIADRRAATTPGEDLIGRLIAARDGSEALSDKEIRDQIKIFLFAGHDTTATLVTFALYLLGRDAQAQERVRQEAERQLPEAPPTTADLAALGETTMVLKEAARLYPPAPYIPGLCAGQRDLRLPHPGAFGRHGLSVGHSPSRRPVAGPVPLRPAPFCPRQGRRAPQVRVAPVRPRPARLHRGALRHARSRNRRRQTGPRLRIRHAPGRYPAHHRSRAAPGGARALPDPLPRTGAAMTAARQPVVSPGSGRRSAAGSPAAP
ncbi:cytochrome P450 [Nocardia tengchongensis]